MGKAGEKATTATQDVLWRLMRARGWGAIRHVERSLGWPQNKLHKARERGMTLDEIFAVLVVLQQPPGPFFASVFGDGPTTAGDRFLSEGADLLSRLDLDLPELATPERPDVLVADELERIDAARFEDPRRAIKLARDAAFRAASEGRRGDAAACIARMGSALRAAEQWHAAHAAVTWALNHAPVGAITADAWRRAAAVVADYGEFDSAADLAQVAMVESAELADVVGVARALVSRGIRLRRAGRHKQAIKCLESALVMLPIDGCNYRCSAHQILGFAFVASDRLDVAADHANEAERIDVPPALARHIP